MCDPQCATVLTCVAKALNAGVGGLMREAEQKSKKTDQDMQEAFSDMKALMVHVRRPLQNWRSIC